MDTNVVRMDSPGEFSEGTMEIPDPGPDDILLRVELTGICGTDIHVAEGGMDLDFPIVPGHEFCGVIEELGANVECDTAGRELREGDAISVVPFHKAGEGWYSKNMPGREVLWQHEDVFGLDHVDTGRPGGMSNHITLPPEARYYRMPDDMDVELGAMAEPMSIGVHAYERAAQPGVPDIREGAGIGHSVAVQGAGMIGLMSMVAARAGGCGQLIAIDAIEERLETAEAFGATDTVNVADYDGDEELVRAVKELTDGNVGPDTVIEATGVPRTIPQAIEIPHDGGTFVEAGHFAYTGDVEINPTRIVQKELQILGARAAPASQFRTGLDVLHRYADEMPFQDLFNHRIDGLDAEAVKEAFEVQRDGGAYRATVHPNA
jgi:L-iditol 2-dehydrogenase